MYQKYILFQWLPVFGVKNLYRKSPVEMQMNLVKQESKQEWLFEMTLKCVKA